MLGGLNVATPELQVLAFPCSLIREGTPKNTCRRLTTGWNCRKTASPSSTATVNYQVPDNPIIPFIEGDGTGRDIWKASQRVFDAAVEKAYGGKRTITWFEIFAGEKAYRQIQHTGCRTTR